MAVKPVNTIFIDVGDVFVEQNRKSLEMQADASSFLKHSLMDHCGSSEDQNAARKMDSRTAPMVRGN